MRQKTLALPLKKPGVGEPLWYYPLMVDSEKRPHGMMRSTLLTGGDFLMPPRKGQKQQQYDEATKS
ncbi:hypothetical protein, partial [Brevibacillus agri]